MLSNPLKSPRRISQEIPTQLTMLSNPLKSPRWEKSFCLLLCLLKVQGLMGFPQTPSSHPYPPSLQLRLYQSFIISVPILFTIILFLLFYLFYLKRRRNSNIPSPQLHPRTLNEATVLTLPIEVGLKRELREKLPTISFEEELKERDSQCCVRLGDFEIKEQLHQIPSCRHMFHVECIHHWLRSNTTCPLCRASILTEKHQPL